MTAGNNAQVHGSASARVSTEASTEAKFREHASRQRFVRVAICVLMSCLAATASSQPTASQPTASQPTASQPTAHVPLRRWLACCSRRMCISWSATSFRAPTATPRRLFDRVEGFTGGALDGGICAEAMAPFERWVDAVRAELGARQRGDVVDPAVVVGGELARAIAGTMTVCREYEARRNQFELARVAARQQFEAAR